MSIGSFGKKAGGVILVLALCIGMVQVAQAEDFTYFGKQQNFTWDGHGICAAVAAINSFIYLENQYPNVYDNLLTPHVQGSIGSQTDPQDSKLFAYFYYNMPGQGMDDLQGWNDYMTAKEDWIDYKAPGTTVFDSMYPGSTYNNGYVSIGFLTTEEMADEDVELFISGDSIAHALTVTGISGDTLYYQDSNTPGTEQSAQLQIVNGELTFVGLPGTGEQYDNTTFTIDAAFSESPVPEPVTLIFLGTGILGLIGSRVRREVQVRHG